MRKTIKIFIASSIVEFANERMAIENFIHKISDNFEEQYDVKIKPILCENLDDAYSTVRKQEEYNEEIRQSELCFFIFFTKAGQYTQEEFEVARKAFEDSGKPKIYTYFKIIKDGEGEQSLYDFMKKLDEVFGHYYGTFDHVDTIKLRILLSLKLREMDFLEIKSEDGKCVVDGKSVMLLDNVAEFQNNSNLVNLQKELKEVEQKYYEMKPIYAKGGCDDTFYREYCKVASRRQDLIDEIEQLQKAIFNMSMRMSTDETHGEVTPRQKEAYRLFELGDYEGCMAVLDAEEIKNDYLRKIKMLEEQKATVCRKFIRENKTAIDILMAMTNYQGRFDEIIRRYEDIVPVALAEGIELNVVYDYVVYLWEQNNHKKAIKVGEKLSTISKWNETNYAFEKAKLHNTLAYIFLIQNNYEKAKEHNEEAIRLFEIHRNLGLLVRSYIVAGKIESKTNKFEVAEKHFLKALGICKALVGNKTKNNKIYAIEVCAEMGTFYLQNKDYKKAQNYYNEATKIITEITKYIDSKELFHWFLKCCSNLIIILKKLSPNEIVGPWREFSTKIIENYELLAKENPERYNPDLVSAYHNVGNLYRSQSDYAKAEEYYLKALELYRILAKEKPIEFNMDLIRMYTYIGFFYDEKGDSKKSKEYRQKGLEEYRAFIDKNP